METKECGMQRDMDFETRYRQIIQEIFQKDIPGFFIARDFCLGEGKRIRPALFLDACHTWSATQEGSSELDRVLTIAVAIELLHRYLLIHDDLMDRDVMRRGKPTVYAECHRLFGVEQGEGIAIAVGDYLANEVFRLWNEAGSELFSIASRITRQTIEGQLLEYVADPNWSQADIEQFYSYKTALYTFQLPLLVAHACSCELNPQQDHSVIAEREKNILIATQHLGIAYQFRDDLLEFIGEKKRDEKGERDDFSRGKMTIISRLFLDRLDEASRINLTAVWKQGMDVNEAKKWKQKAKDLRVIEEVETLIEGHIESARDAIQKMGLENIKSIQQVLLYLR